MATLFIPIIEGATRPQRRSINVARLIEKVGKTIEEIEVQLIDPLDFTIPYDGDDEGAKDPKYSEITKRADGFFLVIPEYNHSFPGGLKRLLDSELDNYIHKPVAFAGVANGNWGGVRAIEQMVGSVREMGMVATFTDVQFPNVSKLFDENGKLLDESYIKRIERSFTELIWMAKTLKYARENIQSKYHHEK